MAYRSISFFFFFIISYCFLFNSLCYSETDTLHQGQEFKDWDELISSNKVFSMRFFSFGTMVSPYLGIFYIKEQIRDQSYSHNYQQKGPDDFSDMPVWVANKNNPIPDIYGKLIIDGNGKLSILSGGGPVFDLFSPTQLVTRNVSVTLLYSGNLVLREMHPNGSVKQVLWQSFDYPTDTLLPGMKLGVNLKTGHKWSLNSWRNYELPAEGSFKLYLNETSQMVILWKGNVHWRSGPWQNGEFDNTHIQLSGPDVRLYYVSNETEQSFTYYTRTYDSHPGLRIQLDGELTGSPLHLSIQCPSIDDNPGCAEDMLEKLKCRKDYEIGKPIEYRSLSYSYVDEHVYNESYNIYDCIRMCWSDCSCVAFTTTRNRIGCTTYGKKVYSPEVNRQEKYEADKVYYPIDYHGETDTLHQGQEFKDWDELVSSNKVFCMRFFSFGTMVSPYLGIFYNKEQIREQSYSHNYQQKGPDDFSDMPVWVANKNNPISDIYGKLIIDGNGKLSILSGGGPVFDLFSPTQLVTRNVSVTLLYSGNLVLREMHPNGSVKQVLWQSFDYPTDTLLPGMKLGVNLKTGHRWSLNSWRNIELPAEGSFKLYLDETSQMVILRQGNVHWRSGPWQNGEFDNTHIQLSGPDVRLYYVSNETEQSFTYYTRTYDSHPGLRIQLDSELTGSPLHLSIQCRPIDDNPGCAEDMLKKLKCRKAYNIGGPIEYRSLSYSYVDEHVYNESYSVYDCIRTCWSDCSCVAFKTTRNRIGCTTYGKKVYNPEVNRQETYEADKEYYYPIVYQGEAKMEKMSNNNNNSDNDKKNYNNNKALIGLIFMIATLVVLLSCYWAYKNIDFKEIAKRVKKFLMLQMRRVRHFYIYVRADNNMNTELHYFTFQSISSATNNFSSTNKLGKGGFGEVFKGKLVDGQEIAVKRLSRSSGQGVKEFKNETELIAKLQHTNLVRLIGCCVEKQEKILVYEYMPNNSLDFFLFDTTKKGLLDWNNRFVIIDGIAQGLLYLHKFSRLRIIHRDLKASNILLDDYLKPKISDFGMAKLFGINESEANTSRVVGTRGYMPPEYLIDGIISTKIDVFGFGVLLLEIISSKMNHGTYDVEHPLNLLGLAWELWSEGRGLEFMDPVLEDTCTPKDVMTCIHVGLLCVQDHAMDRPNMSEVVSMLTNENMHLPEPKQPAFFIERHETETDVEAQRRAKWRNASENDESISILVSK
ncbi:hypothetical protein QVD17_02359 [Tagetes erecta]|uniref:non-specific serine/threonine protein kinase n=1 Tax=Tagetes erecta TaxID=13708 RepID=A0AAD8P7P8_TARER|nr:hypothetical protein QVD17_02359 [Tagetes erecta]